MALDREVRCAILPYVLRKLPEGAQLFTEEQLTASCNLLAGRIQSKEKFATSLLGTIGGCSQEDILYGNTGPARRAISLLGTVAEVVGAKISGEPLASWTNDFEMSVTAFADNALSGQAQTFAWVTGVEANIQTGRMERQGGPPALWISASNLSPSMKAVIQEARLDRVHPRLAEFTKGLQGQLKKRHLDLSEDTPAAVANKKVATGVFGCYEFRQSLKTSGTGVCTRGANCLFSHEDDAKCPRGASCPHVAQGRCYFSVH
jgi:hypothetical protein